MKTTQGRIKVIVKDIFALEDAINVTVDTWEEADNLTSVYSLDQFYISKMPSDPNGHIEELL